MLYVNSFKIRTNNECKCRFKFFIGCLLDDSFYRFSAKKDICEGGGLFKKNKIHSALLCCENLGIYLTGSVKK